MRKTIYIIILLITYISSQSFAQTSHTCPTCKGRGKSIVRCDRCHNGAIYCETCDYRGVVYSNCYTCNGRGQTSKTVRKTCAYCNGERYTRKQKESACSCRGGKRPITRNGRTEYITCSRCSGTGVLISYYNAACRYCGGEGYYGTENISQTCSSCSGNGTIKSTCNTCKGKGCYVCSACDGYANIEKTCTRCNGYGKIYTQ